MRFSASSTGFGTRPARSKRTSSTGAASLAETRSGGSAPAFPGGPRPLSVRSSQADSDRPTVPTLFRTLTLTTGDDHEIETRP